MIVSWNWLGDYLDLKLDPAEVAERLSMSGLNHEETTPVGDDLAIDLEVTSNRPDCLGHVGVAREIGVLYDLPLKPPAPQPTESGQPASEQVKVRIDAPELCYRYTARVIRGVKVGPSPDWLVSRLATINRPRDTKTRQWKPINNIVDITNYVLMELGQPLHAFDIGRLSSPEIIVRSAEKGETFEAIDHQTYELSAGMCVIADPAGPVALGGVMGGASTEVGSDTTDLLIESAEFNPLAVRNAARALTLFSDSSYRFERGVDPNGVLAASDRCCELILDLAGGELSAGAVDVVGRAAPQRPSIVLRLEQIERVLGIKIPADQVRRILAELGNDVVEESPTQLTAVPPSWRRDLAREIDLIEETARIHGYDKIPEDEPAPMTASHRTDADRVAERVRGVLSALGYDEAMTASLVGGEVSAAFSPWSDAEPIASSAPLLRGADLLRRSLVPSLLAARRTNESLANAESELYEVAAVYLPRPGELPREPKMLALASGGGFYDVKGAIEAMIETLDPAANAAIVLQVEDYVCDLFEPGRGCRFKLGGEILGYLGEVSAAGLKQFGLRSPATVAELDMGVLASIAVLAPQHAPISDQPAISRDLNLILPEPVRWAELASTVRAAGGELVEDVSYQETYRDAERDGPDRKRVLFTVNLRDPQRTLTGEEADRVRDAVAAACEKQFNAALVA